MTEASAIEDEAVTVEELPMIKARTMYNMVEELDVDGAKKLLFLTNPQAELIASNSTALQKMLDVLVRDDCGAPSLVIDLLVSPGFSVTNRYFPSSVESITAAGYQGVVPDKGPYLNEADERAAMLKLDLFMSDVIIPLAVRTNAIVLCSAIKMCVLSMSFLRMVAVQSPKWGGKPPFTVVASSLAINTLYANKDETAYWRRLRKASRTWRMRDKKLQEVHGSDTAFGTGMAFRNRDVDPNATCIVLFDTIDPVKEVFSGTGYTALMDALVRHLHSTLPSLAIKIGCSCKTSLDKAKNSSASLASAVARAQSGTPVLFLDVRPRLAPPSLATATPDEREPGAATRHGLIEKGKQLLAAEFDALAANGTPETFDCGALAYLYDVLYGDGDAYTIDNPLAGRGSRQMPLHEAIRRAKTSGDSGATISSLLPRASSQQVIESVDWLTDRLYLDAWALLEDREAREARGESHLSHWAEQILACARPFRARCSPRPTFTASTCTTSTPPRPLSTSLCDSTACRPPTRSRGSCSCRMPGATTMWPCGSAGATSGCASSSSSCSW